MKHGPKNETVKYGNLAEIVPPLLRWYDSHARILPWREDPEPYAVWISEIMLQQTRVEAVKPYFDRWMKAFPDLPSLAAASEAEVMKLWEGLGYYIRARNIHRAARLVMEQYGGSLPCTPEGLRGLPGIGEYTAGAVASIAFGLSVACVDGNVLRVVSRLTADKANIDSAAVKKRITEQISLIIPYSSPGDFNQAMMELGATVCLPNGVPMCGACPVSYLCEARRQDRVLEFAVRRGKRPRKIEKKTVLVLLENTRTALRKRPGIGLLAGLWEFPNYDGTLTESEVRQILTEYGYKTVSITKLKNAKHIFSHVEWEMAGYLALVEHQRDPDAAVSITAESGADYGSAGKGPQTDAVPDGKASHEKAPDRQAPDFEWVSIGRLEEKMALPAAFKAFYQSLKHYITRERT